MRVRDVESHSSRAARADLDIGLRARAIESFGYDLGVTNQLWQCQAQQMFLHDRLVDFPALRSLVHLPRTLENVLIGERGRGIDAVHDRVGRIAEQQLKQQAALQHLLSQIAIQVPEYERAVLSAPQHDREVQAGYGRRHEHIPPLDIDRDAAAIGLERACRRAHFILVQRYENEPPRERVGPEHAPRDGMAHETTAAEQHYRPITELHGVARSLQSPGG